MSSDCVTQCLHLKPHVVVISMKCVVHINCTLNFVQVVVSIDQPVPIISSYSLDLFDNCCTYFFNVFCIQFEFSWAVTLSTLF